MEHKEYEQRKNYFSDIMYDLLYLLRCGINEKMPSKAFIRKMQEKYDAKKIETLYQLSHAHLVDALTGTVLKKAGVKLTPEWEQSIAKAIRKAILFEQERTKIFSWMDQQGIWHMPLKGVILKEYYPSIGMRQMSDNDILFDKTYAQKVHDEMIRRGYRAKAFGVGNHDVYEKEPIYNFEMHTALYGNGHNRTWVNYYEQVKNRLILKENTLEYHFSNEDFYVYIITHAFKHFSISGTGIRSLLDVYAYLNRLEDQLDFAYIEKQCELLDISDFEKKNRMLCKKVFQMSNTLAEEDADRFWDALAAEEKQLLLYYMTSGVYGTTERRVANSLHKCRKKDGKISKTAYIKERLFPGKEKYPYSPFWVKYFWLKPFYWVYRGFRIVLSKERRNRALNEIRIVKKIS